MSETKRVEGETPTPTPRSAREVAQPSGSQSEEIGSDASTMSKDLDGGLDVPSLEGRQKGATNAESSKDQITKIKEEQAELNQEIKTASADRKKEIIIRNNELDDKLTELLQEQQAESGKPIAQKVYERFSAELAELRREPKKALSLFEERARWQGHREPITREFIADVISKRCFRLSNEEKGAIKDPDEYRKQWIDQITSELASK